MAGFLSVPPHLKAAHRRPVSRGMARELKVVKVGADIEVSP